MKPSIITDRTDEEIKIETNTFDDKPKTQKMESIRKRLESDELTGSRYVLSIKNAL